MRYSIKRMWLMAAVVAMLAVGGGSGIGGEYQINSGPFNANGSITGG